ncbi:MAG: GNAT family N-acetyltransferase [Streptosporangiaceae bacterium]
MSSPVTDIRLVTLDDAEAITAHLCRDAGATARWDPPRSPDYYTLDGQRRRIERMLLRHATGESWPGVVLDGDAVIGQITVQEILQRAWRKASLGYWIGTPHQGHGHATRAVGLAIRVMISDLGLHRAEAVTQIENTASQNVLRKNRFLPIGIARERIFTGGSWHDEIMWERLLEE